MAIINKIIAMLIIPLFLNPSLPFLNIAKIIYAEKEVISLSENYVGTAEDPVYLTAHRGITAVAPENTIPAYEKAVELGFYAAECDILLTKDNVWVLNHNDTTDKMFFEMGNVADYTLEELRSFSMERGGKVYLENGEPVRVPTLAEALNACKGKVYVNLDLKAVASRADLIKVIQDAGMQGQPRITRARILRSLFILISVQLPI